MAGVLTFADYLGGPDNITLLQVFPTTQKIYTYDFGVDCSAYKYALDFQTLVVTPISYDRHTGEPNFSSSQVIGYFPKVDLHGTGQGYAVAAADFAPATNNGQASAGTYVKTVAGDANKISVLYPAYMYTGPLIPDARSRVCVTVVSFSWADGATTTKANIETFRLAFLQCYEPDATIGDPTLDPNYTAFVVS